MPILRSVWRLAFLSLPITSATQWEERVTSTPPPSPLVIPQSQYWDGDDGAWSSFGLQVGTPPQNVRVIVSTNSPQVMVVLPQGCTTEALYPIPPDCASARGGLFNNTQSTTWNYLGTYGLNTGDVGFEANLGYAENSYYGLDTVGLGSQGTGGPILENQTVAAFAVTSPMYTGILGLNTQPVNYSVIGNSRAPSLFTSLRSQKLIPSLSWSYTAGAKYRLKAGQYAQLIFGGYDKSRFVSNSASFTLAGDITRDIVVAIQSITYSGTTQTNLLHAPIYAFIESTDPNIWLPEAACQEFERAFGISVDEPTGLYLLNKTQYTHLQSTKPQVTFTLSNSLTGGDTVNIVLPFAALALTSSYPFTANDTYYHFPLRKAASDDQITLGRSFLQEAYLTVDYERGNFTVSQCSWVDGAPSQIATILSAEYVANSSSAAPPTSKDAVSSKHLTHGAIAAIVIALFLFAMVASALAYYFYIYRRKGADSSHAGANPSQREQPTLGYPESTSKDIAPLHELHSGPHELDVSSEIFQLSERRDERRQDHSAMAVPDAAYAVTHELDASGPQPQEMEAGMSPAWILSRRFLTSFDVGLSPMTATTPGRHQPESLNVPSPASPFPSYI